MSNGFWTHAAYIAGLVPAGSTSQVTPPGLRSTVLFVGLRRGNVSIRRGTRHQFEPLSTAVWLCRRNRAGPPRLELALRATTGDAAEAAVVK